MMNVNETFSFPELSHQDGDLIIGISAFQTLDESAYSFNIWNPAKNALDTLIWNSETGLMLVSEKSRWPLLALFGSYKMPGFGLIQK